MGSVILQINPVQGLGPAFFDQVVPLAWYDGITTSGIGADHIFAELGDPSDPETSHWNFFYLIPPILPGNRLPTQLQSTWYLFNNSNPALLQSPDPQEVVIQAQPQPYVAGEARVYVPVGTTANAYVANFTSWSPGWPLDHILIAVLANNHVVPTEAIFVLYYADPPSAHYTVPSPGQVFTTTVSPSSQWSYIAGDQGGPQVAFRQVIYTQAQTTQPGFNPGVTVGVHDSGVVRSGTPAYTVPAKLRNTTTYVAYLTVAQEVNGFDHWANGWATQTFTISIPPAAIPAQPSITATVDSANARIAITATQSGATPAWSHVLIERSRDAGATWETVRNGDVDIAAGTDLAIYDYEIGNGEAARYRATSELVTTVGGVTQVSTSSPSVPSADVAWSSQAQWLKAPLRPDLNQVIDVRGLPTKTRRIAQGKFDVAGRGRPVVVTDVRHDAEGTVVFSTVTDAQTDAFNALLDLADTLLLQFPPGWGWGSQYVALGDANEDRVVPEVATAQQRFHTMAYTVVDAPVGDAVITVPVVVVAAGGHLLDPSGNFLTDAAGNRLTNT